jgi:hypothetical protein
MRELAPLLSLAWMASKLNLVPKGSLMCIEKRGPHPREQDMSGVGRFWWGPSARMFQRSKKPRERGVSCF